MSSIAGFKSGYSSLIPVYGIQIISPLFLSLIIREDNTEKLLFLYSLAAAIFTLLAIMVRDFLVIGMLATSFFSIGGWVLFILSTQKSYPQKMRASAWFCCKRWKSRRYCRSLPHRIAFRRLRNSYSIFGNFPDVHGYSSALVPPLENAKRSWSLLIISPEVLYSY